MQNCWLTKHTALWFPISPLPLEIGNRKFFNGRLLLVAYVQKLQSKDLVSGKDIGLPGKLVDA